MGCGNSSVKETNEKEATKKDQNRVFRKNRFANLYEEYVYEKNRLDSHSENENLQVRIKVKELFDDPEKSKGFMYETANRLFGTDICISKSICEELKKHFYKKVEFNNMEEVMKCIKEEISNEAQRCNILDKNQQNQEYLKDADDYILYLDKKDDLTFEEKMVYLFTFEGFLGYSINSVLRNTSSFNSVLYLYFTLLQASISIVAKKYNGMLGSIGKKNIDGEEYYQFSRGAKVAEKFLLEDKQSLDKKICRFKVFNEFLTLTYDEVIANSFLNSAKDELDEDEVPVRFNFLLRKKTADSNPNLMCLVEDISVHPQEKEVLLSSSTIFKVKEIKKQNKFYEVSLIFLSNGFNKFDFLKYSSQEEIDLIANEVGEEGAKMIAEALKFNSSIKTFWLNSTQIGAEGAKMIGEALKTNSSLKEINLTGNNIGFEGAKMIAEALKMNISLEKLYLSGNEIGDEGGKIIGEAIKTNPSLQEVDLGNNQIGDNSAKKFGEALKTNTALKIIMLNSNEIGDEGAKVLAQALKTNPSLQEIHLSGNTIGNEAGKMIGEALKTNTSLKTIDLSGNQIGDEGVKVIAEALKKNTSVQEIILQDNQIEEEGTKMIEQLNLGDRIIC